MTPSFSVGLTRDFLTPQGEMVYEDIGLSKLEAEPNLNYAFLDRHEPLLVPELLRDSDVVISLTPKYTAATFEGVEKLTAILRFGVGYDMVDVAACTEADVLLCITAGAVNHSVAEATIGWMLALSHRMADKDKLVRNGGWGERSLYMGSELRDRTLGVMGLGGIGGKLIEMLRAFGMKPPLAYDPFTTPERAQALGAKLVSLEEVLGQSDFVSINCPLTDGTRNLIGATQLALMKPTAYLINTARGGIVDEAALTQVLREKRIAGAATDVFEAEPTPGDNPLLQLDNVLFAPHCIAWTDELFRDIGHMCCEQAILISRGEVPPGVVNREVLDRPGFRAKLQRHIK